VTRVALIALGILLALGLVVSVLPVNNKEPLGDVRLEGVKLELYPAADPDAKWTFQASNVVYNPDTRESKVDLEGIGKRIFKGEEDLELTASQLIIDGNDNLRTQQADVYVRKECTTVKLGFADATSSPPVVIDQNTGYRAPYAEIIAPDYRQTGSNLDSSFDLKERFNIDKPKIRFVDGGNESCVNGKLVKESK
jgi:hypothetical protein